MDSGPACLRTHPGMTKPNEAGSRLARSYVFTATAPSAAGKSMRSLVRQ